MVIMMLGRRLLTLLKVAVALTSVATATHLNLRYRKRSVATFDEQLSCLVTTIVNISTTNLNCNEERFWSCYRPQLEDALKTLRVSKMAEQYMISLIPFPKCVLSACYIGDKNISTSWYRDFTTNSIWKDLKRCHQSGVTNSQTLRPCEGFLPLQWTQSGRLCDKGLYNCADRSDEGDCRGIKDKKIPVDSAIFVPVVDPGERGIKYCNATVNTTLDGVIINSTCVEMNSVCLSSFQHEDLLFHPKHMEICRNKTFFVNLMNSHCEQGEIPCNDNYPGYCTKNRTWQEECAYPENSCIGFSNYKSCDMSFCTSNNKIAFSCNDGKFCINNGLLCDGYEQCEDGSDEDPLVCDVCPKLGGWPYRREDKALRATLKCKHRYNTNRTICAVPCDGIDDMCLNYEDEDFCKIPSFISLLSYVAIAALLSGLVATCGRVLWKRQVRSSKVAKSGVTKVDLDDIIRKGDKDAYQELRESQYLGSVVQNFIMYIRVTENLITQKELSRKLYDMEASMHKDEAATHIFILQKMGTNKSIGRFFDLLDKSLTVKTETYLQPRLPLLLNFLCLNSHARILKALGTNFIKVTLYYTDVCKDVLLADLIYSHVIVNVSAINLSESSSFPVVMFLAIVGSILVTELCNLVTLITHPEFAMWPRTQRVISAILTPLMPAYILLTQLWHEINLSQLVTRMKNATNGVAKASMGCIWGRTINKIGKMATLLYEFRANENSTEHIFQLVLLTIIIEFSRTSSPILAGFNKVFIEEGSTLVYISALISVFSLVRGPIAYHKSLKNGFLGMIGSIILTFYFAIGTAMRLFMIMLLFTPVLGLFDTMNHYTKGKMAMFNPTANIMYDSNQSYRQLWEDSYKIQDFNHFFSMSTYVPFGIVIAILAMHLSASFIFTWPLYKNSSDSMVRRFMRGIHTLCHVPLFCDWEEFYRNSDFKTSIPVCWHESKKLFAKFQCLFLLEHALMLIPMVWLNLAVNRRHTLLEEGIFKPLKDEVHSKQRVDLLLGLGIAVPVVGSLLQAGIAYAYFRFGHPWKRVLESQVFSPESDTQNETTADENTAEKDARDGEGVAVRDDVESSDVEGAHGCTPGSPQPGSLSGSDHGTEDRFPQNGTNDGIELTHTHSNLKPEAESLENAEISAREPKLENEKNQESCL